MGERHKVLNDAIVAQGGHNRGISPEDLAERLTHDYERLRAELGHLRSDVRRLSEINDATEYVNDLEDEPRRVASKIAQAITSHPVRFVLFLLFLAGAASAALQIWNYTRSYQSTDDAQLDAHIAPISSRITGTVDRVYVEDNQSVEAGQLLAEIDPHDYQTALDKARADYMQAEAQTNAIEQDEIEAQAKLAAAQARVDRSAGDVRRFSELRQSKIVSQHEYDQYLADSRVAVAEEAAARAAWQSLAKAIVSHQASMQAARAALEQALLDLTYTKLKAPVAGIVGKRGVDVGQRVQPGEELLAIVQDNDLWVTANFKETQLAHVAPGQPATVYVDAFGRNYSARVLSVAGASGAKYSLLPPENATGNYVKVVQRIPVRIGLEPGQIKESLLRPGMSVEATIWLK